MMSKLQGQRQGHGHSTAHSERLTNKHIPAAPTARPCNSPVRRVDEQTNLGSAKGAAILQPSPKGWVIGQSKMRAESPRFTIVVGFSIDSNGLRTCSFQPAARLLRSARLADSPF
jgi:hypothetical protein